MNILRTIEGELCRTNDKPTPDHPTFSVSVARTGKPVYFGEVPIYNRPADVYTNGFIHSATHLTWRQIADDGSYKLAYPTTVLQHFIPALESATDIIDIGSGGSDAANVFTRFRQRPNVVAVDAAIDRVIAITPDPAAAKKLTLCNNSWEHLPTSLPKAGLIFVIESAGVYGDPRTVAKSITNVAKPKCVVVGTERISIRYGEALSDVMAETGQWTMYQAGHPDAGFFVGVKR